jgi:hypothetical protein
MMMIKTEQSKYFGSSLLVNGDYHGTHSVNGSAGISGGGNTLSEELCERQPLAAIVRVSQLK